ncbi:MAG TPA: heparinase II/III family protein, partial [Bryobacteraceae bacterium]|nr:heparinase II/III family protein [Bryobacteraceae bacterium]
WVYGALNPDERIRIMRNLLVTAESSRKFLERGEPDINHNYTYMALNTVAVCGLVLHGEAEPFHQTARQYLELARDFLEPRGMVLETWAARRGAWAEGSHYTFHETLRNLIWTLAAYRTATNRDYFERSTFPREAGRFLVGMVRPDLTFERLGDCAPNRVLANHTVPVTVEMLAWGLGSAGDAARLRSFAAALGRAYGRDAVHPAFQWGMRFFHEPSAPVQPSYQTLPRAQRFGPDTSELIVFRSGWDPDATQITIVAGGHFTDHQHFDKGHFLIYRRGGLVVDGGAYDAMYRPGGHWNEYACRTLAHNCLLVYDPQERLPAGYSNDGGQRVLRGMQHHRDWHTYVAHRSREGLDTAKVMAYAADPKDRYYYVAVDLGRAYGEKVTYYVRSFVYLPGDDFLVIQDRMEAAAEFSQRWLLHFQERPEVDGQAPASGVTTFPEARRVTVRRRGRLDLTGQSFAYDGVLFLTSLLPERRELHVVGGPGFEYYHPFLKVNFMPVRPGVAAEVREPGAWRIEVAPRRPQAREEFLHAFQIAAGSAAVPGEVCVVSGEGVTGAHYRKPEDNRIVVFASKAGPLKYRVEATAAARHVLVGLPPGKSVQIRINGRRLARAKTTASGALTFQDRGRGEREISLD